jgi:hypothetical protein
VLSAQAEIGSWKNATAPARVTSASNVRKLSCHQRSRGRAAAAVIDVKVELEIRTWVPQESPALQ